MYNNTIRHKESKQSEEATRDNKLMLGGEEAQNKEAQNKEAVPDRGELQDTVPIRHQKAILVVSFGTSHRETMGKTIEQIETDIGRAYPDHRIYRAFTSKMIINILKSRGVPVMTVKEAMDQMLQDGMNEVIVQPTHILNGIENDIMMDEVNDCRDRFRSVKTGVPLLTSTQDYHKVIRGLMEEQPFLQSEEALVYMGHGTVHYSNTSYAALEYIFRDYGQEDVYVGTVEAYPALNNVIRQLRKKCYKKIKLVPFMIVSGDHALNDMAGEEEDSWKSILEKEGYEVSCSLKGLGEYKCIRDIFIEHVAKAR